MNAPGGSMVTMSTAAGGPVGSAPMVNQAAARQQHDNEMERRLNTYIYDYLCQSTRYDLARQFAESCEIKTTPTKPSPHRREPNGVDDGMDTDSKDDIKRPHDLPYPDIPHHASDNSFLYDWWCQFWDIFGAARRRGPNNQLAENYLQHNMNLTRVRQMNQQQMLNRTTQNMLQMQQFNNMSAQPNGINMHKQAMQNQRNAGAPANMMQQKMLQNHMQRDGSMGENRPQSPSAMGNAPSPTKRPRIDDGNFNGQPGPAGRGQAMQGAQMGSMPGASGPNGNMMLQNGLANEMSQQQMNAFSAQNPNAQKSLEVYQNQMTQHQRSALSNLPKAMNAGGVSQGPLGQNNMEASFDMINQRPMANGAPGASQGGNHALQDYQMQLMLLEQQNKKRLLMARQEQDNVSHVPTGPAPAGAQIAFAPAMSPQGSRAGPSPNPNEQMKRIGGTPKMGPGTIPGSPAMTGDMQSRNSPAPVFEQGGVPPGIRQQLFSGMGGNPGIMGQPPSSHPGFPMTMAGNMTAQNMEQMRSMNGARLTNGQPWPSQGPSQQMMQPGQQVQQVGTPQQRNTAMPPPPAPNQESQRTQPSSPANQPAAPPTPSQTAKPAPKGKKEAAQKKQPQKAVSKKGGAAAATPASESNEPPVTPTPSTPITPMNQASFNKNGNNAQGGNAQQAPAPHQAAPAVAQPQMDAGAAATFVDDLGPDNNFNLDFAVDGPDVLENFDFDSFLHTDDNSTFPSFDLMNFGNDNGVEAGGE